MTSFFDKLVLSIFIFLLFLSFLVFFTNKSQFVLEKGDHIMHISSVQDSISCLAAYDISNDKTSCLTGEGLIVNKYVVLGGKIFFLGLEKSDFLSSEFLPYDKQNIYELDLNSARIRIISSSNKFSHHEMIALPSRNSLMIRRTDENLSQSSWWVYKANDRHWKKWNEESLLFDLHFSSVTETILAADALVYLGYILTPFDEEIENPDIPIGNFNECYGFNESGEVILCKGNKDNEILESSYLVVFYSNGSSETFYEDGSVNLKHALWANEQEVYIVIESIDSTNTRLLRLNTKTKESETILNSNQYEILNINNSDDKLLISLKDKEFTSSKSDFSLSYQDELENYFIWTYDSKSKDLNTLEIKGLYPSLISY